MKKALAATLLVCGAAPAAAQGFPGEIIAEFYMSEFSVPKGWELSYKGLEGTEQVFVMDRDLDAYPQTAGLRPLYQIRNLMCGDETLRAMINGGTIVRVDSRDRRNGRTTVQKGPQVDRC